jgi:hypothetical protein
MAHVSAKDIPQVLGYRLLAPQHVRRARRGVAVDDAYLGLVGIEVEHRVEVVPLLGAAQGLEVNPGAFCSVIGLCSFLPPYLTGPLYPL